MTTNEKPIVKGLWRDNPLTREGKYLVMRRDGTIPEWPHFTLGARDPVAPVALMAYAQEARKRGINEEMCRAIEDLASQFVAYRALHGEGDPDRGKHREDLPAVIAMMRLGRSV